MFNYIILTEYQSVLQATMMLRYLQRATNCAPFNLVISSPTSGTVYVLRFYTMKTHTKQEAKLKQI